MGFMEAHSERVAVHTGPVGETPLHSVKSKIFFSALKKKKKVASFKSLFHFLSLMKVAEQLSVLGT